MLGSAVANEFTGTPFDVAVTTRAGFVEELPLDLEQRRFDVFTDDLSKVATGFTSGDFIINCIGIIKPHIKDDNKDQRKTALLVNSLFPHALVDFAETNGVKIIQIATDCVFSGARGSYNEKDEHDALDVYGKTKSLGEIPSSSIQHLRVSIIGPEVGRSTSLLEWVRNQAQNANINGFQDHLWNGIPTKHFGKLAKGIIENNLFKAGVHHVVPGNVVNKFELVSSIAKAFNRGDINVAQTNSKNAIDRTLTTLDADYNETIWNAAGYISAPSVQQLVAEIPN